MRSATRPPSPEPGIEAQQVAPGGCRQHEGEQDETREDMVRGVEERIFQEVAIAACGENRCLASG
jgi:hypothetical protein